MHEWKSLWNVTKCWTVRAKLNSNFTLEFRRNKMLPWAGESSERCSHLWTDKGTDLCLHNLLWLKYHVVHDNWAVTFFWIQRQCLLARTTHCWGTVEMSPNNSWGIKIPYSESENEKQQHHNLLQVFVIPLCHWTRCLAGNKLWWWLCSTSLL